MKTPRLTLSPCHLVTLSVLAIALPALAADTPSTSPATAPAPTTATAPAPMPIFTSRDSRSSRYSRRSSSRDSYSPRSSTSTDSGDDILLRKSIFAKDRRPAYSRDTEPRETSPASTRPPGIPVLIGVMREDTGFVAYVQDPDSGNIWPFAAGDPLPGNYGAVQDVTLDYMDIAKPDDAAPLRILLGQTLTGKAPDFSAPAPSATPTPDSGAATAPSASTGAPAATTPAAAPADTSGLSIEERMKLRAKQQRGQ